MRYWVFLPCLPAIAAGLFVTAPASAAPTAATPTAATTPASPSPVPAAPTARTGTDADDAFGLHLADPYRWMEGESNAAFSAWLAAQGAYGRARLDAQPRLESWRARLNAVAKAAVVNRLQQPMGGRIFFLRLDAGREGVLMVRDPDGRERTLLDPNTHPASTHTTDITGFSPSADGTRVAVNVQEGGSEISDIVVLDAADGARAADVIKDVWGEFQASWLPDGTGFTYTQMAPKAARDAGDPLLDMRVRLHRLGTPPAADPVLAAHGRDRRVLIGRNEFPIVDVAEDSDFAMLIIGQARAQFRACMAPRAAVLREAAAWNCVVGYDDNVQQAALAGRRLYTAAMKDHPNGALTLRELDASAHVVHTATVLAEDRTAVITGLAAAKDALYVRRMRGGPDELLGMAYPRATPWAVSPSASGSIAQLATDPRRAGAVFTLQSWTQPRTAYRVSADERSPVDLHLGATSPRDYADILADEVTAKSADGTEVPLTVLHRRDAQPSADAIAILEGYGGYGISLQPEFDPFALEWVAAGHVYAIAHVRGGGENGDGWRIAGSGPAKERGVEDYIACAQGLVQRGFAGHGRVVAWGGSMGGILVGGAITRSPDIFAGAVIQSGELNPSRLAAAKNGANQFAEVGDPHTEAGLKALAAMDPYQRIRPGTPYPPVLLIVGINDNRVAPWNSGKFGARLTAASAGRTQVWFRTDMDMGHFTTAQSARAFEMADVYTFAEIAAEGQLAAR